MVNQWARVVYFGKMVAGVIAASTPTPASRERGFTNILAPRPSHPMDFSEWIESMEEM